MTGVVASLGAISLVDSVKFDHWAGDCASAGTGPTCTVTMNGTKNVTAVFKVT